MIVWLSCRNSVVAFSSTWNKIQTPGLLSCGAVSLLASCIFFYIPEGAELCPTVWPSLSPFPALPSLRALSLPALRALGFQVERHLHGEAFPEPRAGSPDVIVSSRHATLSCVFVVASLAAFRGPAVPCERFSRAVPRSGIAWLKGHPF